MLDLHTPGPLCKSYQVTTYLRLRGMSGWTQRQRYVCFRHQRSIFGNIRNGAADIYRLELEPNGGRSSSSASKEGRSRDHLAELLTYKKSRLRLAVETLEKLGLGERKSSIVRIVVDVAELAGTVLDVHLKG